MSDAYPAHEGLQVAAPTDVPEVYYGEDTPEVVQEDAPKYPKYNEQIPDAVSARPAYRWCGIRRDRALLLLIAVALVVIGAVVGGTVGSIEARKSSASSSSTTPTTTPPMTGSSATPPTTSAGPSTTTSTTSTSSSATPTGSILPLNCPAINNTQYTTTAGSSSYSFELYCLVDFASSTGNIGQSLQYSFDGCVNSCSTYNSEGKSPTCQGVTFDANLTAYRFANCFMKTSITGKGPYKLDDEQASALLLN